MGRDGKRWGTQVTMFKICRMKMLFKQHCTKESCNNQNREGNWDTTELRGHLRKCATS